MPRKYYVLLYNPGARTMTFPIKALSNPYNDQPAFAGGHPAMFGGSEQGDTAATLIAEVDEESRHTLQARGDFVGFYAAGPAERRLEFFQTANWAATGTPWRETAIPAEREMQRIATVSLDVFAGLEDDPAILDRLVTASGAPGGTSDQVQAFVSSATAAAFLVFIRAQRGANGR